MRVKAGKQCRKIIQYYRINFHFREPYKVVVDGNFLKVCVDKKVELKPKMEKILGGKCLLATTSCILSELQQLGENFRGIFIAARRLPKEKCKHSGVVEPSECIKAIVGDNNDDKVIVATQDSDLINELSRIPGVPTMQLLQGKILIHEPADEVKENLEKELEQKRGATEEEKKLLRPVIKKMKEDEKKRFRDKIKKQRNKTGVKIKRKAKGANPLSRMKGKKDKAKDGKKEQASA